MIAGIKRRNSRDVSIVRYSHIVRARDNQTASAFAWSVPAYALANSGFRLSIGRITLLDESPVNPTPSGRLSHVPFNDTLICIVCRQARRLSNLDIYSGI